MPTKRKPVDRRLITASKKNLSANSSKSTEKDPKESEFSTSTTSLSTPTDATKSNYDNLKMNSSKASTTTKKTKKTSQAKAPESSDDDIPLSSLQKKLKDIKDNASSSKKGKKLHKKQSKTVRERNDASTSDAKSIKHAALKANKDKYVTNTVEIEQTSKQSDNQSSSKSNAESSGYESETEIVQDVVNVDNEVPTSLAFARRVIESPHYDGQILSSLRPSLLQPCDAIRNTIARGPGHLKKDTLRVISHMNQIYTLAKAVDKPSDISKTANQLGYRFPMNSFVSKDDRSEIKNFSKRTIMENEVKKPQFWVYFFPSTKNLSHAIHYEFLSELFPEESDREFIDIVGDHKDTSMLCLAIQDSFFINKTTADQNRNNVICMVSFKALKESHLKEENGCFIYYLGTLQGLSFHEVSPTNGNMNDLKGPITSNGFGEWMLRLTQLLSANITKSPYMFLVANPTTSIRTFYKNLHFEEVHSWNIVGKEVLECAKLESVDTKDLVILRMKSYMSPQKYTTQQLIMRTCQNIPRLMLRSDSQATERVYDKKMNSVLSSYVSIPLKPDIYLNRDAENEFNKLLPLRPQYTPDGPEWSKFHEYWSGKSWLQYWDIKKDFQKAAGQRDQTLGTSLPIEDLTMDFVSFGMEVTNNIFHSNHQYTIKCQSCGVYMTKDPLSYGEISRLGLAIVERHIMCNENPVFCFVHPSDFSLLSNMLEAGTISIIPCDNINSKSRYNMYLKASLEEYRLPYCETGQRARHTRNIFMSMLKEYLDKNMLQRFFERAVKNSFNNLTSIATSIENDNQAATLRRSAGTYELPEYFKNIYKDLTTAKANMKKLSKSKKHEWDLKKIIGLQPNESIESYSKSPSRATPSKSKKKKTAKSKEETYSDKDIKRNWKTLMHFSKRTWNQSSKPPIPQHEIDSESLEQFFVGRSDIKGKKIYFIVSSNIIPRDQKSFVFQDSFFARMAYNTEYDIPQYSIDKLNEAIRDAPNYVIVSIQPCIIDGVKMWKGKRKIGSHTEPQSLEWLKSSFLPKFKSFYEDCMDDGNIGKHLKLPSGKKTFDIADPTEQLKEIPPDILTDFSVPFTFGDDAYCAFGNMANAMHIFGDKKAARFFFSNRHKHMPLLQQEYPEVQMNLTGNQFLSALQIVRHMFKYSVKKLEYQHDPCNDDTNDLNVVKYVEIERKDAVYSHVICIHNDFIVDGSLNKVLHLSKESLLWLCDNEEYYLKCYTIEPSKKVKRALASTEQSSSKKQKT